MIYVDYSPGQRKNKSVSTTSDILKSPTQSPSVAAPPDWSNVPFEVSCARCDCDLHGLTEPVCPRCKLEFDWSKAVPIENLTCDKCDYHLYGLTGTRCPECGTDFTWKDALAAHHRRNKPLFEYRWRERPVRSFLRTWKATLRPRRLWSGMDIHDPPNVGALIAQVLAFVGIVGIVMYIVPPLDSCVRQSIEAYRWTGSLKASLDVLAWLPMELLSGTDLSLIYVAIVLSAVWCLTNLASLLIYRQSMSRYKIRTSHVVRVWAYSGPALMPVAWAAAIALPVVPRGWGAPATGSWDELLATLILLYCVVNSIRYGYRDYLRMPHSLGVAIASQTLSILASLAIADAILQGEYAGRLIHAWGRIFGLYSY